MGTMELSSKVSELRELRRMAEELAAEIEGIQDAISKSSASVTACPTSTPTHSGTQWHPCSTSAAWTV